MSDFVTLNCPTRGGKLHITDDIDRFTCLHCGNEHIIKRGEGIIALSPVMKVLNKVQLGVDRTASELAIRRLDKEVLELKEKIELISSKTIDYILFLIGLGLVFGCIIFALTNSDFLGSLIFVCFIIIIFAQIRRRRVLLESLEKELNGKLIELRKHKEVISQSINGAPPIFGVSIFFVIQLFHFLPNLSN